MNTDSRENTKPTADTRVSNYDVAFSALVAGTVVTGVLVFILFMIWLALFSSRDFWDSGSVVIREPGQTARPKGIAEDWKVPGVEEYPEVEKPQLTNALERVTKVVSTALAASEKIDADARKMGLGPGLGFENRRPGPNPGPDLLESIPAWDRWTIQYSAATMSEYMEILESFDITLGAVSQLSNQIEFVDDLTNEPPTVRVGTRDSTEAQNPYFRNERSRLRHWDRNRVASAGIDLKNKLVVLFYSPEIHEKLLELEKDVYTADGMTLDRVERTMFRCRPAGDGYEYDVEDIRYRPPTAGHEEL